MEWSYTISTTTSQPSCKVVTTLQGCEHLVQIATILSQPYKAVATLIQPIWYSTQTEYQICNDHFTGLSFNIQPLSQSANVNDSVTFTCEASGASMINYTWTLDGSDLMDDPGHIEGASSSTLMIIGVNVTDGGEYSCRANYSSGNITSDPALLYGKVHHIKPLILQCFHIHIREFHCATRKVYFMKLQFIIS